jgi:hypothetical protein
MKKERYYLAMSLFLGTAIAPAKIKQAAIAD